MVAMRRAPRRKLPATTLLYALGLTQEEILAYFYGKIAFKHNKDGSWTTPLDPTWMRNAKSSSDWKNAKTGDVVLEAGAKITVRTLRKLQEDGVKNIAFAESEMIGRFSALDMVNPETGEIYVEAGDEVTRDNLASLAGAGFSEIEVIHVDALT